MIARLQKHFEAIESSMMKRKNVIRFLLMAARVGRDSHHAKSCGDKPTKIRQMIRKTDHRNWEDYQERQPKDC